MAISLLSSVLSLPTLTLPANWSARRSMVGLRWRHGPHQTAQKSTRTGFSLLTTSCSQLAVVSSTTFGLAISGPPFIEGFGVSLARPHYTEAEQRGTTVAAPCRAGSVYPESTACGSGGETVSARTRPGPRTDDGTGAEPQGRKRLPPQADPGPSRRAGPADRGR